MALAHFSLCPDDDSAGNTGCVGPRGRLVDAHLFDNSRGYLLTACPWGDTMVG